MKTQQAPSNIETKKSPTKKKYIIGTRGSLLALTQCNQIKKVLEDKTGDEFELKIIKTEGDLNTEKPLWQMDGKDFFTKELDQALLMGEIDLVVHSYKDLGSERPEGIKLGAITERTYPHDILLMDKKVVEKLKSSSFSEKLIIGTSSPRRIYNIENFLSEYLPGNVTEIKTKQLRGNVNTRVSKLVAGDYHGIVLALPGLERLALTKKSADEIAPMLGNLTFSVLPTSQFPAAASQGALGLEFNNQRDDNGELEEKLSRVHHKATADAVKIERKHFQKFGGGCHLAVGITTRHTNGHLLTSMRGTSDGKKIHQNMIENFNREKTQNKKVFIGVNTMTTHFISDQLLKRSPVKWEGKNKAPKYVTTKYAAIDNQNINDLKNSLVFSAGSRTWKEMAQQGIWVHGSADAMGEEELASLKNSAFLSLMTNDEINNEWQVLTHDNGSTGLGVVTTAFSSDRVDYPIEFKKELLECDIFFWASFRQYEAYLAEFPEIKNKTHCTGMGKTLSMFKEKNIDAQAFTGMREFKNWANIELEKKKK